MKAVHNKRRSKLILALAICSLLLIAAELAISQSVSSEYSRLMQEQRRDSVAKMAQLAYNAIGPILDEVHDGSIDSAAARKRITDLVRNMTYYDEYGQNYIFMSSYDGTMLVQPYEPGKEGSDQWDLQDSDGRFIIRELVKAAIEKPEGSFVSYHYYLPGENRIEEKLSYVIGLPEIDAYIGTGMYIESSYKELQKIIIYQRCGFLAVSLLILGVTALYIRALVRTNQSLFKEIKEREYAESNIRTVFDSIHDAVMIHDLNGKMVLANKGAGILYDIPEDQLSNYNIKDLSADGCDPEEKLTQAKFLENESLVFDWKCRRPLNGSIFDGEVALRKSKWSGEDVIVAVVRDISERKKNEEEIRGLAYFDYLTSLHNRVFIMNELRKELEQKRMGHVDGAHGAKGAILFIDLDNFKTINDSYGHFFGDGVLRILADRLKKLPPAKCLPARIGGDEFVILCYGAGSEQITGIASEVLSVFRDPIVLQEKVVYITCSIGIALYPEHGNTVETIFKNADTALYRAKDRGKNNYALYGGEA